MPIYFNELIKCEIKYCEEPIGSQTGQEDSNHPGYNRQMKGSKRTNGNDRVNYLLPDLDVYRERRKKFYGPNPDLPDPTPESIQLDLISESRLTGYCETMKTIRALKEKGSISAKRKKVEEDIKQFFLREAGVDFGSNRIPRNTINYKSESTKIEVNSLVIANIQMMSRKSAVVYMKYFQPKQVIFLSLNSMKVVFDTQEIAERALYAYKHSRDPSSTRIHSKFSGEPFSKGKILSKKNWHQLMPYSVFGIEIPLFGRFATNLDVKDENQLKSQKYEQIRDLKARLQQQAMNTKQDAKIIFEKDHLPPYFESETMERKNRKEVTHDNPEAGEIVIIKRIRSQEGIQPIVARSKPKQIRGRSADSQSKIDRTQTQHRIIDY